GVKMAKVAFEGRDRDRLNVAIQGAMQCAGLYQVIPLRALAVGIDVPQIRRLHRRLAHGRLDGSDETRPSGAIGETGSVAAGRNTDDFRVDFRAAANGVVVAFDDKGGSAFADNSPVAIEIEWPAGTLRIVRPRQPVEQAELGDIDGMNIGARSA